MDSSNGLQRALPLAQRRIGQILEIDRMALVKDDNLYRETKAELELAKAQIRNQTGKIAALFQLGRDLSANDNWSDALDRFLMAMARFMDAEGLALLLFSHENTVLRTRSSYGVDGAFLEVCCRNLLQAESRGRAISEIHAYESYLERDLVPCHSRETPWRTTLVPLRHRSRNLGYLALCKAYGGSRGFLIDSPFLTMLQGILAQEVSTAAYISQLRNLSRFNQRVLESISNGVITTDKDGIIEYANLRASELLGSVVGQHFDDVVRPLHSKSPLLERLMGEDPPPNPSECLVGPIEEPVHVNLSSNRFFRDEYHGSTLVVVLEDLTEQKAWEEQLRRADRLASLGVFSAGVAHEIRNPLTGITTAAEILREKFVGRDERKKFVDVILEEIHRLDEIIESLLRFARPAPPRLGTCSLAEIARQVLDLSEAEAAEKNVRLSFESALESDLVQVDRDQIEQVLLNLVKNAVQACAQGGKVRVSLQTGQPPPSGESVPLAGEFARICVEDDGCGFEEEDENKLFNPFFTTKPKGTGLGLSISQKIIEEHQGTIRVEKRPLKGTRFLVDVPCRGNDAAFRQSVGATT